LLLEEELVLFSLEEEYLLFEEDLVPFSFEGVLLLFVEEFFLVMLVLLVGAFDFLFLPLIVFSSSLLICVLLLLPVVLELTGLFFL